METCCLVKLIKDQCVSFHKLHVGERYQGRMKKRWIACLKLLLLQAKDVSYCFVVTYNIHTHMFTVMYRAISCAIIRKGNWNLCEMWDVVSNIFRCMAPWRQRGGFSYFFTFDSNNFSAELIKAKTSIRRPCVPKLLFRAHVEES